MLVKYRRSAAFAAIATVVMAASVLFGLRTWASTGSVTAAGIERATGGVIAADTAQRIDLSAMRAVETKRIAAPYATGQRVPARIEGREGGAAQAIVGGRISTLAAVPGAVLIESAFTDEIGRTGYGQCTGFALVELGPRYIALAAHCVVEKVGTFDRFDIWYGAATEGEASRATMRRTYGHVAYVALGYDESRSVIAGEDVAVIELVEPLDLQPHEMARLATMEEYLAVDAKTDVIVAGWGSTEGGPISGRDASPVLKSAIMRATRTGLTKMVLRSPDNLVEGVCQGDSGGGSRLATDPRIVLSLVSYVAQDGGGVCVARGFAQYFTAAPLIRLALGLTG